MIDNPSGRGMVVGVLLQSEIGIIKLFNNCKGGNFDIHIWSMRGSRRGDRGSKSPLKNHENIGFLSKTGPDSVKITKLPSQHSM